MITNYESKSDNVVLESLFFLRKQEKIKSMVKWDTNKSNFDHHLINLKCVNGSIARMKIAIAREMCLVDSTQVSDYINWCTNTIKSLETS
jgi:hypothetical protein